MLRHSATCRLARQCGPLFFLSLLALQLDAALPDLVLNQAAMQPYIDYRTFSSDSCEVGEGCASPGTRRLLYFTGAIRNIGTGDLVMGRPEDNPLFVWDPCHGHYHFEQFALYRLLDGSGLQVVISRKFSFCLEDTARFRDTANPNRRYSCGGTQGIQAGWADIYDPAVPCQWLDITGLPGGNYIIETIVDPQNLIAESNEGNNVTRLAVTLPSDCVAPANDSFSSAAVLSGMVAQGIGANVCASKEAGEPNHAGDAGGRSIWYQWTPTNSGPAVVTTTGSDFDTLLAVYTGTRLDGLTLIAANDDIVPQTERQSRVLFNAVSGTTYRIAVDGWHAAVGRVILKINPPPNDAFANCASLAGIAGTNAGYNLGASKEQGEPAHAGNIGGHSVWYCWTAPTNSLYVFYLDDCNYDSTIAVYTGNTVSNLTLVASDDNSAGNDASSVRFVAANGQTCRIAVDGFSGATGNFRLKWTPAHPMRLSILRQTNAVVVRVYADPGEYDLLVSSNLPSWSTAATFNALFPYYEFTNPPAMAPRFYRVKSP